MCKSSDYFVYSLSFASENSMGDLHLPGLFGLGRHVKGGKEVVVDKWENE
ncbi:hypothetical protein HMPREF9446_03795 [Bacteroides fluxus YIT 12057]|uniref:Uncharacterized protein n=1 Tax=Bacteroides fluxus YIT 12057 TaxID=763034 RepID=F3PYE7_9BACE|nr:hypothetical protein HMPREF9446_03795 [Bacteroides fluxus YIT 12057]